VTKWCVDIPMYVIFTSREQKNFYITLDIRAVGVLHFRLKYEPVFCVVKYIKIRTLNFLFNRVDNWDANLQDGFP